MPRSSPRLVAVALGVVLAAEPSCRSEPAGRRGPANLVLILIDTLRQDHLRSYGYARETAPTLTRLAAQGATADGLSPTSWTKPAVASLLTGLHPLRHQVIGYQDGLPEAALTLAERLRGRGYRTLGVTANGFTGKRYGFDHGFDELVYLADVGHGAFASSEEVDAEVFRRLGTLRPPFFLFVHYLDPHAPYEAPAWGDSWLRKRPTIRIQDLEAETFTARPPAFLRDAIDAYDAEIRRVDGSIGRLLGKLQETRLAGPTLTIVASDHGEEFEEHGRMGHGQTLYDEVVRIPLIFHWPGVIPPGGRHGRVSLLDVFPTALDLLGAGVDAATIDGVSLASPLSEGRRYDAGDRPFLLHVDAVASHDVALVQGSRKLVVGRYPHRKELFDLASDPGERRNRLVAGAAAEGAPALAQRLAEIHNGLEARALPRVALSVGADQKETLAALGYIGGAGAEVREIPERIGPPPLDVDGPLGWEEPRSFKSCLDTADLRSAEQLLEGWYAADRGGRWTWPAATAVLAVPEAPGDVALRVAGAKRDAAPARLRISLEDHVLADQAAPAGDISLVLPLAPRPVTRLARLRIERAPAYLPAAMGLIEKRPFGEADHRQLGLYLSSICLETARPRLARGAS